MGWGGSLCKPKGLKIPFSVGYTPHLKIEPRCSCLDHRPNIVKKVSLITFRQILAKIFPEACILNYTIMTYLKNFVGTKSLNTKRCPVGLSPRIMPRVLPFQSKFPPPLTFLCYTHQVCTAPPLLPYSSETLHKTLGIREKSHSTAKNLLTSPTRKLPLNKFMSTPIKCCSFSIK